MRALVAEAMEPALKPLVYRSRSTSSRRHRERGERVYIVSAALQEIVDALAEELGFDGALGSVCEVVDGRYTGRSLRACHGVGKGRRRPRARRGRGHRPGRARPHTPTATSDLPFLEAVGSPVAVNPDRELRQVARERGWPILAFREPLYPAARRRLRPVLIGVPLALGAAVLGRTTACCLKHGSGSSASRSGDARALADHFEDAERRGKRGHGLSRIDWLAEPRRPRPGRTTGARGLRRRAFERWEARGAVGLPRARRRGRGAARLAAVARARGGRRRAPSRPACSATGCGGSPRAVSRRALTATSPRRLGASGGRPAARRDQPARDRNPQLRRPSAGRGRLDGQRSPTATC